VERTRSAEHFAGDLMLVTFEKWHDAIKFLTEGIPGISLTPRDVRLLSLHLEKHQLTVGDARMVLARIGWYVSH
jgi:hypothetical protein